MGYLMTAPALLLLVLLVGYPVVMAVYFSLTDKVIGQPEHFVGLRNFIDVWQSDIFRTAFANTFIYALSSTFFKLVFGFLIALLLNQKLRFRSQIRAAVLLPWIIPTVLSVLVWSWMLDPTFSVINYVLVNLHLVAKGPQWLSDPSWAKVSTIIVQVWRGLPYYAITFLAGLQTISPDLYEAASVDGATVLQKMRHITLPLLQPVITVVVTLSFIWAFSDLELVWVLTRGGPVNSTHLLATLSYNDAIFLGKLGEGSAISLYMFPVLLLMMVIYIRRLRKA